MPSKSIADMLVESSKESVFNTPEPKVQLPSFDPEMPSAVPSGAELAEAPKQKEVAEPQPKAPAGDIVGVITAAAKKHGVDPARLLAMAYHESGGDPNAVNKKSGAKGLFQALPSWSKDYDIVGKEFDPTAISDAAARSLKRSSGTQNPYVSYLIHNQGRKGAEEILRAAAGEVPLSAQRRRNMLAQPNFQGKTAPSDKELATAFITKQRAAFMKHYTRAQKTLGQQAQEQEVISRGSGGMDWDGLLGSATQQLKDNGTNMMMSSLGEGVPRTRFGGKL